MALALLSAIAFAVPPSEARFRGASPVELPRPDRVVIVIEENKSYGQIVGNTTAPYINSLAEGGALLAQSYALTHPSQPNYLAVFSGSTHGAKDDTCPVLEHAESAWEKFLRVVGQFLHLRQTEPVELSGSNLASELIASGLSFGSYSESMPSRGYTGCEYGDYYRKHNPAVNWQGTNVPPHTNMPFEMFPSDYAKLPTVSLVPNLVNDMHEGKPPVSITRGDHWLKNHLDSYVNWAATHNSLLILTWDEDDHSSGNHIATIFVGPMVKRGIYQTRITHYNVLRTLTDMYGLRPLGDAAKAAPITGIWTR